jgi:transcription elongation GreA/GreB family factor
MTLAIAERVADIVGRELRRQVRDRWEQEYRRLSSAERPALVRQLRGARSDAEAARVRRAVTIADYHLAAIADHLAAEHKPHPDDVVCAGCCVLLDRGTGGPEWFLLAALPEPGPRVIASDSALGRALIGVRADQSVDYPDPTGMRTVRVLALG